MLIPRVRLTTVLLLAILRKFLILLNLTNLNLIFMELVLSISIPLKSIFMINLSLFLTEVLSLSSFSFGQIPVIHRPRSVFDLSHTHLTAFNVGQLVPFEVQEVYPGDSFKIKSDFVCRVTSTFLKPVMDNLYLDQMYFFVPNRLICRQWEEIMGENKAGSWAPSSMPALSNTLNMSNAASVYPDTVADFLGVPPMNYSSIGSNLPFISVLPFRAFALIYNEWFRDENLIAPMNINLDVTPSPAESFNSDPWSPLNYFGRLPYVSKFYDYFTACLPAPQKGNPVRIPLGTLAPVVTTSVDQVTGAHTSLHFNRSDGSQITEPSGVLQFSTTVADGSKYLGYQSGAGSVIGSLYPSNLSADLSNATGASVNDLRLAFQTQKLLERDARGGTRYIETIRSGFGVEAGDYRLQRPEFLGGSRNPLQIQQVAQTSAGTEDSPLAELSAYSLTNGSASMNKGFTEHGFIIGVACIRQKHTYQQGLERFWRRSSRLDFYDPVFQSIGEQPVYGTEIYAAQAPYNIFGYMPAWSDLRYRPSRTSGVMRSTASNSLDLWHFADAYSNSPVLSSSFITETSSFVDRTLSVPSSTTPQFIFDFRISSRAVRRLPVDSVPSLIDHH